mmetsp:Transcript_19330/g.60503  ORF Transcript_19330/g.60503 Transcript_19330/m.60503 type:complete len:202 (-) Transcript_19330:515-1120(-)
MPPRVGGRRRHLGVRGVGPGARVVHHAGHVGSPTGSVMSSRARVGHHAGRVGSPVGRLGRRGRVGRVGTGRLAGRRDGVDRLLRCGVGAPGREVQRGSVVREDLALALLQKRIGDRLQKTRLHRAREVHLRVIYLHHAASRRRRGGAAAATRRVRRGGRRMERLSKTSSTFRRRSGPRRSRRQAGMWIVRGRVAAGRRVKV